MFEGFAQQWTPLLPSSGVTRSLRSVTVAGTPLVTWRAPDGQPLVFVDRCPHRGVALSLGSVTDDGGIACAFHGWEFDRDGRCTHVPFNPGVTLVRLGATALPSAEAGGLVWVFTGFGPLGDPSYPASLDDPAQVRGTHLREWKCHWTRALESLLDSTHVPYVHAGTMGRLMRRRQRRDSVMRVLVVDEDFGFGYLDGIDDHPPTGELFWYRPNLMVLEAVIPPRLLRLYIWCVPIDEGRTRLIEVTTRNFATGRAATAAVEVYNRVMFRQIRRVVETSPAGPVPDPHLQQNVPTDKPALIFRSWYLRELAGSSVPLPGGPVRPDRSTPAGPQPG